MDRWMDINKYIFFFLCRWKKEEDGTPFVSIKNLYTVLKKNNNHLKYIKEDFFFLFYIFQRLPFADVATKDKSAAHDDDWWNKQTKQKKQKQFGSYYYIIIIIFKLLWIIFLQLQSWWYVHSTQESQLDIRQLLHNIRETKAGKRRFHISYRII